MNQSHSATAFDHLAPSYDSEATNIALSRWLRERVWQRLAVLFNPGDHVLEIGCGTGEDAIWLAKQGIRVTATDGSTAMLAEAQRKASEAGVDHLIEFRQLDLGNVAEWQLPAQGYDGAFSNFGALNCTCQWQSLGQVLAQALRPGGKIGVGVMPPFCAWETLWHLLRLRFRHASRRWRGTATADIGGVTFPVYYPTPQHLLRGFGAAFQRRYLMGLGVFIPPSDLYQAVARYPRLVRTLIFLEKHTAVHWPFRHIGDHFWLEVERVSDEQ